MQMFVPYKADFSRDLIVKGNDELISVSQGQEEERIAFSVTEVYL